MILAGADQPVRKVTIVGGGTAGWMTAAVLSQWLSQVEIRLVESEEIGTVGVGEATIPHIRNYLALAGVDPLEMIAATKATFKLGIQFVDWGAPGESYIHGFGNVVEAVRQIRGESTCQVEGAELSLSVSGPGFAPGSAVLFGKA